MARTASHCGLWRPDGVEDVDSGFTTLPSPMLASRVALLCALLALGACADVEPPPLPPLPSEAAASFRGSFMPVDDGARVPGFARFRSELREAVARKDTAAFLGFVASGARLSFGDEPGGPEGFRAMWFSGDPPEARDPWRVLAGVLDGGSVEEDNAVTAPFVYGLWPADADPFTGVAVVGQDVPARLSPDSSATVAARLSHIIVTALGPPRDGWREVRLPDSTRAFVSSQKALSPVGYRAAFWEDGSGRWRLQSFLAGD